MEYLPNLEVTILRTSCKMSLTNTSTAFQKEVENEGPNNDGILTEDEVLGPPSHAQDKLCIFPTIEILKRLDKLGSSSDLCIQREINQEFYTKFNTPYFDSVCTGINIEYTIWDDDEDYDGKEGFFGKLEYLEDFWEVKTFINDETLTKQITSNDWTPKIAHIFRTLKLNKHFFYISEGENELELKKIVKQLSPHITTLQLPFDPFNVKELERLGAQFKMFLNQFIKLETLELGIEFAEIEQMDKLVTFIDSLKKIPNVIIHVSGKHEEVVLKLFKKTNVQLVLILDEDNSVEEFYHLTNRFQYLKNIKYILEYLPIPEDMELKSFTEHCIQNKDQLEGISLVLDLDSGNPGGIEDELSVRKCLVELSPFVTRLSVEQLQLQKKKFDILNTGAVFPKLTELRILGYDYPLEVLKNCPKLEDLLLYDVDENSCLFDKPELSDEENLKENFENLTRLKKLKYLVDGKLAHGSDLEIHLKQLLPRLKHLRLGLPQHLRRKGQK